MSHEQLFRCASSCDVGQTNSKSTCNLEEYTQLPWFVLRILVLLLNLILLCAFGSEQRPGIVYSNQFPWII